MLSPTRFRRTNNYRYSGGGGYGTTKFSVGANSGLINDRWVVNARLSR
ncbi:MAG: hypothetical protein R3C26_14675 [Calditrichia bacterium]